MSLLQQAADKVTQRDIQAESLAMFLEHAEAVRPSCPVIKLA